MIKIAVLDDDIADRIIFEKIFSQLKDAVIVKSFSKLKDVDGDFDVIFTDLNLSGEAYAHEVIDTLRGKYPDTRIIALSGLDGEELKQAYIAHGLDGFINKTDLKDVLKAVISD